MHLFKNKTKNVKQFLQEMKANKTNRSSNTNTLEKNKNKSVSHSPSNHNSQFMSNSNVSAKAPKNYENNRKSSINNYNADSNIQMRCSTVSSQRSISSSDHQNFITSPLQSINLQRISQQQNFYKDKQSRGNYNQRPQHQYQHSNYGYEPASEPIYNDYVQISQNRNNFDPYRSQLKVPIPQPFPQPFPHSYQFDNRSIRSQNSGNLNQYPQKRNDNFQQNFSQFSNSTIYQSDQLYQNSNFIPQNIQYQSFVRKPQSITFSTHNLSHRFERSTSQHDNNSSKNEFQNLKPSYNKMDNKRLFTSQTNNLDFTMEEICEIQDGLSTQKNSPAKLTDVFQQTKHQIIEFHQDHQISHPNNSKLTIQKKLQSFNLSQKSHPKNKNEKNQRISSKKQTKYQNISKKQPKISSIKISESEKHKFAKNLHQVDQVHIKLDGVFKQAAILLANIQRSSDNFAKIMSHGGLIYDLLRRNKDQYSQSSIPRMEIEENIEKIVEKDAPTDKKIKPKQNQKLQLRMNQMQTQKKNYHQEIQI